MSSALATSLNYAINSKQKAMLLTACKKIAPTWPLDQMIAVNPFWQMRDEPIEKVSARLNVLASSHILMPKPYYLARYQNGDISAEALEQAALDDKNTLSIKALEDFLQREEEPAHWHNIADLLDGQRDQHKMAWRDEITQQISQFCAAHYQQLRPILQRHHKIHQPSLYRHWLEVTRLDRGISIVMDEPGLHAYFKHLPDDPEALLLLAIDTLALDDNTLEPYAHALLLDINGWASWVAYLGWQGELYAKPHDDMLEFLAIRMAWELVIWQYLQDHQPAVFKQLSAQWLREKTQLPSLFAKHEETQQPLWIWFKAQELSYQQQLNQQLLHTKKAIMVKPKLQAAFCIDVRSEVIRRVLESQDSEIQTFGFAGFFGLPLEYKPQASSLSRPQLPGLLKPIICVSEDSKAKPQMSKLNQLARWQSWSQAAPSAFSMVETMGWMYAFKMLKKSFFSQADEHPVNDLSHQQQWHLTKDKVELSLQDKAELAKGILHAMGLTEFAPEILLVGHGSHTTNNLHAAGLDCGACGGQTGEVNVRVLAQLLNNSDVRKVLAVLGVVIPTSTRFIAALHNTTTEHIQSFDHPLSDSVKTWLAAATSAAQTERLSNIDPTLASANQEQLNTAYIKRSKDWSQVRPEWGLANNAAFIVAPRQWTRHINLQGRSFLHDYQWQNDHDFSVLELIMTAPMVVTNWINMQYNASVTDNLKYGSGNKVLHNAVGGNMGVFEGNGGDLRIGLAMQSLHNGENWMHQPQRLAVYVAAPREPIKQISAKHGNVRQLIDNQWLYLLRWAEEGFIERFYRGKWLLQQNNNSEKVSK
jgi:uncharacterized protein